MGLPSTFSKPKPCFVLVEDLSLRNEAGQLCVSTVETMNASCSNSPNLCFSSEYSTLVFIYLSCRLEPVALANIEPRSPGPVLPHHSPEQWAQIQERLSLSKFLEERYDKRSAAESPSRFLRSIIMSLSSHWKPRHLQALKIFFDEQMNQDEQRRFLSVMSRTAALALKLPEYLSDTQLQFLKQGARQYAISVVPGCS